MARPIPEPAPVTTAMCPSSSPVIELVLPVLLTVPYCTRPQCDLTLPRLICFRVPGGVSTGKALRHGATYFQTPADPVTVVAPSQVRKTGETTANADAQHRRRDHHQHYRAGRSMAKARGHVSRL